KSASSGLFSATQVANAAFARPGRASRVGLCNVSGKTRNATAMFRGTSRRLWNSPTVRAIRSAQKAGLRFRASSDGRSAHARFQCVSGIGRLHRLVGTKNPEVPVPSDAESVRQDVIGTDGQESDAL